MKGYTVLAVLSLAVALLTPLTALPDKTDEAVTSPSTASKAATAATTATTAKHAVDTTCFKVKNEADGSVLTMNEDEFLMAVVSCEMAPSSPAEALKAQTVAAYTYYYRQRAAAADGVFSNVPETLFTVGTEAGMRQRFGNQYDTWHGVLADTVKAVKGQRILYNGEPITACYHAISAGLTENATDVWGGNYPYLRPVDSAGDVNADGYLTTATVSLADMTAALTKLNSSFKADDNPAAWLQKPVTTASGFVKSAVACGCTFTGTKLRTALSLRSACFTVQYADEKFVFTVRGYGHNVGMSQTGAKYMATQGADYREILRHYYPGTTIA